MTITQRKVLNGRPRAAQSDHQRNEDAKAIGTLGLFAAVLCGMFVVAALHGMGLL